VELGGERSDVQSGLNMPAPSHVFTIARVAQMLGEDEAWLEDIAIEMGPEDGHLGVWGTDDDIAITAFTPDGVEYLKELIELYKAQRPPRSSK
jgi:hypothetical protein